MKDEVFEELSQRDILTVTTRIQRSRSVLRTVFPLLWVEGVISNLAQPASGHIYFTLKDLPCTGALRHIPPETAAPEISAGEEQPGSVRCRVGLYEPRRVPVMVEHMEPAGDGALRQAFETLKEKLAGEGLFDVDYKTAARISQTDRRYHLSNGCCGTRYSACTGTAISGSRCGATRFRFRAETAASEIEAMIELADHRAGVIC